MRNFEAPMIYISRLSAIVFLACLNLCAQTVQVIDVNEPRPLWKSFDRLENILGGAINYEDPPYQNSADVQDYSTPQERAATPGFQQIGPRIGHVTASIPVAPRVGPGDIVAGINLVLDSYRANQLPGDFRVEQANGMFYVTPIKTLAANGAVIEVVSPLSARITIPFAHRKMEDATQAIFDAVEKASGRRIVFGTFPFYPQDTVDFGATNEVARDALARLFALSGKGPLSYRLLFDPIPGQHRLPDYMLNLNRAGYVAPIATREELVPVSAAHTLAAPANIQPAPTPTADAPNRAKAKP